MNRHRILPTQNPVSWLVSGLLAATALGCRRGGSPAAVGLAGGLLALTAVSSHAFVYESDREFYATGDFNGDGRVDVVVVNRFISKFDLDSRYRIAYQTAPGEFTWGRVQMAEMSKATGLAIGKLLDPKKDAIAITTPDANMVNVIDASDPTATPAITPYLGSTLGPRAIAALDIGGDDNTPLDDLAVATIFNSPVENHLEFLRNDGTAGSSLNEEEVPGEVNRANAISLKPGGPRLLSALISGAQTDTFRAVDVSSGKAVDALRLEGLPRGSDYVVGRFGKGPGVTLVVYASAGETFTARAVTESGGKYQAGESKSFVMERGIKSMAVAGEGDKARLIVLYGNGDTADIFSFDGQDSPKKLQTIGATEDEVFAAVLPAGDSLVAIVKRPTLWYSTRYQIWKPEGAGYQPAPTGEMTTPDYSVHLIQPLLEANATVKSAAEMKAYTNTIPGTKMTYAMVPVPGGEFVMGTPDSEAGRETSESPQAKVKLDPFWVQTTEVTWDMYGLFQHKDDERRFKDSLPTDPAVDSASDAVARPSSPYSDMTFGMGKDGFPAIAMTHFGASKFCQWLSAKTGHYYRLPTEAEWEYACRAGSKTAYGFGDSPEKLGDYAWYEETSSLPTGDFKSQKVGTKKPNAWGLYDMHGNVMEWCLDALTKDYSHLAASASNPWTRPTKPYPHVARGGSYDDPAEVLRSGARLGSDRSWKMTDPQLPKGCWWLSDNKKIGFRIVRSLKIPDPETLAKYWNTDTERD